jgi:hypothetical protein
MKLIKISKREATNTSGVNKTDFARELVNLSKSKGVPIALEAIKVKDPKLLARMSLQVAPYKVARSRLKNWQDQNKVSLNKSSYLERYIQISEDWKDYKLIVKAEEFYKKNGDLETAYGKKSREIYGDFSPAFSWDHYLGKTDNVPDPRPLASYDMGREKLIEWQNEKGIYLNKRSYEKVKDEISRGWTHRLPSISSLYRYMVQKKETFNLDHYLGKIEEATERKPFAPYEVARQRLIDWQNENGIFLSSKDYKEYYMLISEDWKDFSLPSDYTPYKREIIELYGDSFRDEFGDQFEIKPSWDHYLGKKNKFMDPRPLAPYEVARAKITEWQNANNIELNSQNYTSFYRDIAKGWEYRLPGSVNNKKYKDEFKDLYSEKAKNQFGDQFEAKPSWDHYLGKTDEMPDPRKKAPYKMAREKLINWQMDKQIILHSRNYGNFYKEIARGWEYKLLRSPLDGYDNFSWTGGKR